MSQLNVDTIKNRAGTGGPTLPSLTVTNNVNVAGLVTAPTFIGNLNGNATGLSGTPNITVQDAVVQGNLTVNGTQTVLNTTELYIEDKTIGIGTTSAATDVSADGAGIIIFGDTEKSFTYNNSKKGFETNIPFVTNETRLITGSEKVTRTSGNVVSLVYNNNSGSNIGFTTNPSGNITLNVLGIPTTSDFDDHSITFAVIVNSTGTARSCTAVTLNGVSKTIKWSGGSLNSATAGVTTTNGYAIYNFTAINTVGSASTTDNYEVFGVITGGFF
jgi:hypothetical protein